MNESKYRFYDYGVEDKKIYNEHRKEELFENLIYKLNKYIKNNCSKCMYIFPIDIREFCGCHCEIEDTINNIEMIMNDNIENIEGVLSPDEYESNIMKILDKDEYKILLENIQESEIDLYINEINSEHDNKILKYSGMMKFMGRYKGNEIWMLTL